MDPFGVSLASLGVGIGSSILGGKFGFDQADAQSAETAEQIRRFMRYRDRTMSQAQAAGGASGITPDSASLTKYLGDMSGEFTRQLDWMKQAGDSRSGATDFATLFNSLNNAGGALFQFGKANNWFQAPSL